MISVSGLTKEYGSQTLFRDVSVQFNPGGRYGLVGANGSGKSTLLRIISGEEEASAGSVSLPRRARLGVLRQDHFRYEEERILDVVLMGNKELWEATAEKERLLARADQSFDGDRYAELEDVVLRYDGYSQEARASEILEGLGIPTERHTQPLSILSGGFKLRVLLAQVLASSPDALVLDEPTNHLDILSIRWLEKFMVEFTGCVLVVSHDHRFLDNVCTHIVDIDYETAMLYTGNYTAFSSAKVADRERKEAEIRKQQAKIAEHKAFVERFRAKATKARQAQSKLKMIDKINVERLPQSSRRFPVFRFEQCRPSGKSVLKVSHVEKSFDDNHVLRDVSLEMLRGDRLAIIGANGIGKSTLLKAAIGDLSIDEGAIEWGYETHPGYFAQDHKGLFDAPRTDVEDWLWESCPGEPIGFVRGHLGKVLFSGDDVKKRASSLSGGETARLVFARLAIQKPNVLILDEPTNHLDMEAIEALVVALESFKGTLVFVSHDRWFVSRLANRILELTPQGPRDFRGSYDEYLERCGDDHLDAEAVVLKARRERKVARAQKVVELDPAALRKAAQRRRQLEKKLESTTRSIDKAETRVHDINELFCNPGFFADASQQEVRKLQREQDELRERITAMTTTWEEMAAEIEGFGSS